VFQFHWKLSHKQGYGEKANSSGANDQLVGQLNVGAKAPTPNAGSYDVASSHGRARRREEACHDLP
jgi:hypothetical protein